MLLLFFFKRVSTYNICFDDAFYYQIKTPIDFWYRRELNSKSLIQPSETLLIELTKTHAITLLVTKNLMCNFDAIK